MNRAVIKNHFLKYLELYQITMDDHSLLKELKKKSTDEINVLLFSEDFIDFLVFESDLSVEEKTEFTITHQNLILNKPQPKQITEVHTINGIDRVYAYYEQNLKNDKYNFQINFYGKTIPINCVFEIKNASRGIPRHVSMTYEINICNEIFKQNFTVFHKQVVEAKKKKKNLTFFDLMATYGLFKLDLDLIAYEAIINKTIEIKNNNGILYITKEKVLQALKYYRNELSNFNQIMLSTNNDFAKIIIEDKLENRLHEEKHHQYLDDTEMANKTPFLRIFSLDKKDYFFIHTEDLLPYKYDKTALSKLIMPLQTRNILSTIFTSNINDYYGDFIKNKHGGMVILAEGPTGVGKTSTAEVYSEMIEKPLYIIQLSELGSDASSIEKNLTIIFNRIQKWNAVLLFDEIDIYLYKRENNLEQAAIVGVFLRLLDYFSGLIFFTTNRIDVLDPAILSRVSLKIRYKSHDEKNRRELWQSKLEDAEIKIDALKILPKIELNGRQIKNAIRVAKVVFGNQVKENELNNLILNYII